METAQITSSAAQLAVPTCATCPMVTLVPPAWAGARPQWLGGGRQEHPTWRRGAHPGDLRPNGGLVGEIRRCSALLSA